MVILDLENEGEVGSWNFFKILKLVDKGNGEIYFIKSKMVEKCFVS